MISTLIVVVLMPYATIVNIIKLVGEGKDRENREEE